MSLVEDEYKTMASRRTITTTLTHPIHTHTEKIISKCTTHFITSKATKTKEGHKKTNQTKLNERSVNIKQNRTTTV